MTYQYQAVVEANMVVGIRNGSEYMVRCPYHENNSFTMQFNVEKGLFVCFSCGATGNAKRLIRDLGGTWVEPDANMIDIRKKLSMLMHDAQLPSEKSDFLPESVLRRYAFPTDYWKGRGFTPETIEAFDLGYDPLDNVATIPARDMAGHLVGVIKRFLDPDALARYRYPKLFPRRTTMFGAWLVYEDPRDYAVIVEGAVDSMAVWQADEPGLGQYGSSITKEQVRLLHRLGIHRLITFYDNDLAGRKATEAICGWKRKLRDGKVTKVYDPDNDLRKQFDLLTVRYSANMKNDPGANTSDVIRLAVANATKPGIP